MHISTKWQQVAVFVKLSNGINAAEVDIELMVLGDTSKDVSKSPMLSPLDALGPTLYRIAWYKLECPHYGGL